MDFRYPAYKKELLAIIYCIRKSHSYIWGRNDITIITDHKPLIYMFKSKTLSHALQQWVDVLLDYNLSIIHRPGILHVLPDALSRMYSGTYNDNNEIWGTLTNLHFINTTNQILSPSDLLVEQSILDQKPPKNIKKRHSHPINGGGIQAINLISEDDMRDFDWSMQAAPLPHYHEHITSLMQSAQESQEEADAITISAITRSQRSGKDEVKDDMLIEEQSDSDVDL